MTLSFKHLFSSAKADGTDVTLVKPSNWNAQHVVTTDSAVPIVLGATAPGPIVELPISLIMPTGVVVEFAGATAPAGWLLCYGQPVSRVTFAALFAVLGTSYGAGDGSTTFNVPDHRGAVAAGASNMGGSDRGNLPGGGTPGNYLGAYSTTTSTASYGTCAVNFGNPGFVFQGGNAHVVGQGVSGLAFGGGGVATQTGDYVAVDSIYGYTSINGTFGVNSSGTSAAFAVVQPTTIVNKIIKT